MQIDALLGSTPGRAPGRVALDDGNRTITYGELGAVVRHEAEFLRATGGLRFALLADNGCGWAIGDLALHHLHQLNVPLPEYFTPAQQHHVVDDAGIDVLVTDRPEYVREHWPHFERAGRSPASGLHVFRHAATRARHRIPAGVTKITYTSGSTAQPKGVCLSAATLDCVSRSLAAAIGPVGLRRHLCLMPLSTLLENIAGIHAALRAGASCIVPPGGACGMSYGSLDPRKILSMLADTQPESLLVVPELLRALVNAAQDGGRLPASLRFVAVGGAAVSRSLLDGAAGAGLPVYEGYGLSECGSVVCLNTPGAMRRGSVGRPLPHVRVRLDADGQICVSGAVMSGYLGDDAEQAPAEIATGDLGEIDSERYVYVRGRLRNAFITSLGRNISPEWVERELSHEGAIRHAVADGESRPAVAALLSPALDDASGDEIERAVARANTRLPEYAQVRHWVRMPEAPSLANGLLTANGRLRRDYVLARFGRLLGAAS
jgi:long-subunit acyl-CoA synthetase (AMP-forming)